MLVENKKIIVSGKVLRTASLEAEYYEFVDDPYSFVATIKAEGLGADLFTFLQKWDDRKPRYDFPIQWDSIAVLNLTTYENWWKQQINDKTRNMVRKAQKSGVEVRVVAFNDDLIRGIKEIYDESRLRQGKPFKHYGKDIETLRRAHISFVERSQFIGAFFQNELIGFIKIVHGIGMSHLMQIISKVSHRSKAPTNALIAKAVEICAQRGVPYLHYGVWSRRSLGDFKVHHAFEPLDIPRYYVPLSMKGKLMLELKLHQKISDYLPGTWIDYLAGIRAKYYTYRYGRRT